MKKMISFILATLSFVLCFSVLTHANVKKRYKLIGTIISNKKNKSFAIIRDTKTSETKVLRAGKKLDSKRSLSIRSIEKDKVTISQSLPQKNRRTIYLLRNQTQDSGQLARERKSERIEEIKDVMENLNDLKELRAYYKKKEKELKNKAQR